MAVIGTQTTNFEDAYRFDTPQPRAWGFPAQAVYPGVVGGSGSPGPTVVAGGGISIYTRTP